MTTTFRAAESMATDFLTALGQRVQRISHWLSMPAPGVPEATAELLRMAAAYDSSQPSYAADLRAAATMAEREAA